MIGSAPQHSTSVTHTGLPGGDFHWSAHCRRIPWVFLGLTIFLAPRAVAQETTTCKDALEQTETAYIEGRFSQAISLLSPCLDRAETETDELVRAYRFLALAYLRSDEVAEARAAILRLLRIAPDYHPDPVNDPPSYRALVDIVRQQIQLEFASGADSLQFVVDEQEKSPSWLQAHLKWIASGGTLIAVGLLAAILRGGGPERPQPLPGPPSMPN